MQIIVFGMHRSGTSVVTRLLHSMGAYVGAEDELLPSMECNREGFWERQDVHDINEAVLASLNAGWDFPLKADPSEVSPGSRTRFNEAGAEVIEKLNQHGLWVLKDPRMCLLYPLWQPLLSNPIGVFCWRNPLEVAASLRRRDGFPLVYGLALWEWYTFRALQALRSMPFCMVSYDELMQDPFEAAGRLYDGCEKCGVSGLKKPDDMLLSGIIKPGLRHEKSEHGREEALLSKSQQALLCWLRQPVGDAPDVDLTLAEDVLADVGGLIAQLRATRRSAAAANAGRERAERRTEMLMNSADGLSSATDVLLNSLSWKVGRVVGACARAVQSGSELTSPEQEMRQIVSNYRSWRQHRDFRVVAIINTYNEELLIRPCIEHLIGQGIEVYILDNESTDRTVEIAREYEGRGVVGVETIHRSGFYDTYRVLVRKEQLAGELDADWFLHSDTDEFRYPPAGYATLREAIAAVDALGYNAIEFMEYSFVATAEYPVHKPESFMETMRWYYPFQPFRPHRLNAWKRQSVPVKLAEWGGHQASFEGRRIYPDYFILRHYNYISLEHAISKYSRLQHGADNVARGLGNFRDNIKPEDIILPSEKDLRLFEGNESLNPDAPRKTRFVEDATRSRLEDG